MSKTEYVKMDVVKKAADEVLEQYKFFKEQGDLKFMLENLDLPVDKVIDIIVNSTIKTFIDMVYILNRADSNNKDDDEIDKTVESLIQDNLALKKKVSRLEKEKEQSEKELNKAKTDFNEFDEYLADRLGDIYNQYKLINNIYNA